MSIQLPLQRRRQARRDHVALATLMVGAGFAIMPAKVVAATADATAASSTTAPSSEVGQVSEVIVTATRREEALRDVPVAVTAVNGQQVREAHIGNFGDLPALTPGANFIMTKGQSTADIEIRGQSTTNDAPALELPVAVFMDDIYYGSLASFDADFYDVSQIAILRGPQGTTFGRNVVGGALQITSNKPQLGFWGGADTLTLESYAGAGAPNSTGFEGQGFVNAPMGEDAAFRFAYSLKDVGGYMHNFVTGTNLSNQKSFSVRPSLLWQPTDDLKVTAFVSWTHENELASGYHAYGQGALIASDNAISTSPWASFQDVDGINKRDIVAAQVRIDLTRSFGVISAITSFRSLNSDYVDDGDNSPLPFNSNSINASKESEFSEELRLTSPSGHRLEYVAGLYYSYEDLLKAITFDFNGTNPLYFLNILTKGASDNQTVVGDAFVNSFAPYAEGKYHFTDQFALTFGARYSVEEKSGYTDHIGFSPFYGAAFNVPFAHTWTAFTPRVILEYKVRPGILFYGSVSTGFKGGGWSLTSTSAAAAVIPLKPETSTSYEFGAKLNFLDDRASINLAAYQADTKNLQVRSLIGPVLTDTNAGSERVRGVELESVFAPFHGAQVGVNYAYTDAIYASFTGCAAGGVNCTGDEVPFTPKNDIRIFAQYRWELGDVGTLTAHVDQEWADATQVSPQNSQQQAAVPFTSKNLLNASLIFAPTDKPWRLQLWGKNLGNSWSMAAPSNYYFYWLTKAEYAAGDREVDRGDVTPPRQVGATFSFKF